MDNTKLNVRRDYLFTTLGAHKNIMAMGTVVVVPDDLKDQYKFGMKVEYAPNDVSDSRLDVLDSNFAIPYKYPEKEFGLYIRDENDKMWYYSLPSKKETA